MKVRFNRWYNAILTTLLTMMGFEACSSLDEPMVEYGVPTANCQVLGTVTDDSGNPVEGIKTAAKIVYQYEDGRVEAMGLDSINTDAAGQYQLQFTEFPGNRSVKLIVEDIDGEAHGGEFVSDTLDIDYEKAVQTEEGKGAWYNGAYQIRQDIKLKKAE